MFHIHGTDGTLLNIPLEELRKTYKINKPDKSSEARKIIESKSEFTAGKEYSYAIKAYKDSIKKNNEREPLLHAYTIMKSPVLTLDSEMTITEAWNYLKEKNVRHMPVISEAGKIIGILSDRDLLKCLCITDCSEHDVSSKKITEIMSKKVITSGRLTDIRRIAKAMFENHIGTMPIVGDSGELEGIITRSDILFALIHHPPLSLWA